MRRRKWRTIWKRRARRIKRVFARSAGLGSEKIIGFVFGNKSNGGQRNVSEYYSSA
jgi:hypothetical protein